MVQIKTYSISHFESSVKLQCEQAKVWKQLIDVSEWNVWDTELKEANLSGRFEIGSRGELIAKNNMKLQFEITRIVHGKSYTFKTKLPVGYLVIERKLTDENNVTVFTDNIQFTGLFKTFFGFLLGRGFKSVLPEVMLNFKNLVEQKKS